MNAHEIYLTKCRKLIVPQGESRSTSAVVATFNRNLMSLGFVCSQELTEALSGVGNIALADLYDLVVPVLKRMTGGHRQHKPFYPNFPKQVMEASEAELFINASAAHYWMAAFRDMVQERPRLHGGPLMAGGSPVPIETLTVPLQWLPEYKVEDREPLPSDEVSLKVINLGTEADFCKVFTNLVGSNGSLSESDKEIVSWFVDKMGRGLDKFLPEAIPQKENLAYLIGLTLNKQEPIPNLISYLKTSTDVLRVAVVMSGGDVSLGANTKFRRFKRMERRFLLDALEAVPTATEDMLRRPEVWKRLGRELRPGDYKNRYPKTLKSFDVVRNNEEFATFNSQVEKAITLCDIPTITNLLKSRPGDFARRLDHVLRKHNTVKNYDALAVVKEFGAVADQVSTPTLLQAFSHFINRTNTADHRTFFPKGSVAKLQVAEKPLPHLDIQVSLEVADTIKRVLVDRFSKLLPLGKVYVDEALKTQFVPFAQRSASKTLRTISRGSRLSLPSCEALRFFVWWKEPKGERTDIDLAASLFDEDWKRLTDVSYYNLRQWESAHSGDITSAPNGACEFIDVNIDALVKKGCRYVQMIIYSYTQQPFKDLPECFAGWMARSKVQSGEVFEGRTVQDKIDIAGDTTVNIPLIIDLQTRQVVWADVALKSRGAINNSARNGDNLSRMGKAITNLCKPTLYDLFSMHAQGRGTLTSTKEEADTVFSMYEGITPFDTDKIMNEFLSNTK